MGKLVRSKNSLQFLEKSFDTGIGNIFSVQLQVTPIMINWLASKSSTLLAWFG